MQKIQLESPLLEIDLWLSKYIIPTIKELRVSEKVSNAEEYSSSGIEISLEYTLGSKIKEMKMEGVTLGCLEDVLLAQCVKDPDFQGLIPKMESDSLPAPTKPEGGKTAQGFPLTRTILYPQMQIYFEFNPFSFSLNKDLFEKQEIIAQYLYYRARLLENTLPLPAPKNSFVKRAFDTYLLGYKQFLLQTMLEAIEKVG